MISNAIKVNVDLCKPCTQTLYMKQLDKNSRQINVYIYDNGVFKNLSSISEDNVYINYHKPDGFDIKNNADAINEDGSVNFVFTEQMLVKSGIASFEVEIVDADNNEIIKTTTVKINIEDSVIDDSNIESSYEYNALNAALLSIESANQTLSEIEGILDEIDTLSTQMQDNESIRQSNETIRQNHDTTIQTNEATRQSNESNRQSNETTRQTNTSNAISSCNTAISACNTATSRANNAAQTCEDIAEGIIPVATTNTLGGIKSGGDITVESDGTASVNVEIGGRNLAIGTKDVITRNTWSGNNNQSLQGKYKLYLPQNTKAGDLIIIHFIIELHDIVINGENKGRVRFHGKGYPDGTSYASDEYSLNRGLKSGSLFYDILDGNATIEAMVLISLTEEQATQIYFNIDFVGDYISEGTVTVKNFKAEKGNIATDWTPAPEDLIVPIANNLSTTVEGFALDALQGKILAEQVANNTAQFDENVAGSLGAKVKTLEDKLNNTIYTAGNTKIVVAIPNYANGGIYGITLHGSGRNGATLICQIGTHNGQIVCTSLGSITATATLDATAGTVTISLSTNYVGGVIDFIGSGVRISPAITYTI